MGESYGKKASKLKENVKMMLEYEADGDMLHKLELIHTLQRLGVSYHFEAEIKSILDKVYNHYYVNNMKCYSKEDLYTTALKFRLLRQHNHNVPQGTYYSSIHLFCFFFFFYFFRSFITKAITQLDIVYIYLQRFSVTLWMNRANSRTALLKIQRAC